MLIPIPDKVIDLKHGLCYSNPSFLRTTPHQVGNNHKLMTLLVRTTPHQVGNIQNNRHSFENLKLEEQARETQPKITFHDGFFYDTFCIIMFQTHKGIIKTFTLYIQTTRSQKFKAKGHVFQKPCEVSRTQKNR